MNRQEASIRILHLREELEKHNYNYYVLNNPEIEDYTFDQMLAELIKLETEFPEFFDAGSPTQRVGSDLNREFKQVAHKYQMLSLSNTYTEEEIREFDQRVRKLTDKDFEMFAELKFEWCIDQPYLRKRIIS